MPDALERAETGRHDRVGMRTGGRDRTGRERRHVQLVVGAEDERRPNDVLAHHAGAPRARQRAFDRRVDTARSRAMGGTGLGLAIVKHLARAHGGEATVQSTPGAGASFAIELPHE